MFASLRICWKKTRWNAYKAQTKQKAINFSKRLIGRLSLLQRLLLCLLMRVMHKMTWGRHLFFKDLHNFFTFLLSLDSLVNEKSIFLSLLLWKIFFVETQNQLLHPWQTVLFILTKKQNLLVIMKMMPKNLLSLISGTFIFPTSRSKSRWKN